MRWALLASTWLLAVHSAAAELPQRWIGADRAALLAALGQPQEIRSDGLSGSIIVYASLRTLEEALDQPAAAPQDLDEALHLGARLYFVDAAGKIYGKLDALTR